MGVPSWDNDTFTTQVDRGKLLHRMEWKALQNVLPHLCLVPATRDVDFRSEQWMESGCKSRGTWCTNWGNYPFLVNSSLLWYIALCVCCINIMAFNHSHVESIIATAGIVENTIFQLKPCTHIMLGSNMFLGLWSHQNEETDQTCIKIVDESTRIFFCAKKLLF